MQTLMLTPRLALAASFVPQDAVVIDVGTDHAYLPVQLILSGKCSRAVAADINAEPLKRAEGNIRKYGLSDKIGLVLCDGLAKMDASCGDTIIIAGMGGDTILGILSDAPWTKQKTLILQPMTNAAKLRRFLRENGYVILDEAVAREDRHLYSVMKVTGGESETDPLYDHISRAMLRRGKEDTQVCAYLDRVIAAEEKKKAGLDTAGQNTDAQAALLASLAQLRKDLGEKEAI